MKRVKVRVFLLCFAGCVGLIAAVGLLADSAESAENSPAPRLPNGRQPVAIANGVYPQDYFPNTETLAPTEMRIVALGTGMPQVIQMKTKASGWYVELGNGDEFLFDLGTGSMENLPHCDPIGARSTRSFSATSTPTTSVISRRCKSVDG